MKNLIVALGDSWAAGEGAWPDWLIKKYNGKVQHKKHRETPPDELAITEITAEEQKHNWLVKLRDGYFPEYDILNLAIPGSDNNIAVQQLYLHNNSFYNYDNLIVILMLTDSSRMSFLDRGWKISTPQICTIYPVTSSVDPDCGPVSEFYAKELYSQETVSLRSWTSILQAQDFADARNAKLVVCNGWALSYEPSYDYITSKFNKDYDLHATTEYPSFINALLDKEREYLNFSEKDDVYDFLMNLDVPSKYLTNCQGAHPTIEGHQFIADALGNFLRTSK